MSGFEHGGSDSSLCLTPTRSVHGTDMNKKILFLGYDESETTLIGKLKKIGCEVDHTSNKLDCLTSYAQYDVMVSFGYRHVLPREFIASFRKDIINLHVSLLPFNRGAHPNFWAFFENTPHGVTIHLVDEGIDTGPILYQQSVTFDDEKTFSATHSRLLREVESLFVSKLDQILSGSYAARPQRGKGTYHAASDLPAIPGGWGADVQEALETLDKTYVSAVAEKLSLIDEVEKVRTRNNVNWMDVLRLAFRSSPREAARLMQKINSEDGEISKLLAKLGE